MPIPWMSQLPTSPSKNGSSTEFYISATQSYSNALFWDHLGAQDFANHLTWVLAYTSAAIRLAPKLWSTTCFSTWAEGSTCSAGSENAALGSGGVGAEAGVGVIVHS